MAPAGAAARGALPQAQAVPMAGAGVVRAMQMPRSQVDHILGGNPCIISNEKQLGFYGSACGIERKAEGCMHLFGALRANLTVWGAGQSVCLQQVLVKQVHGWLYGR